jgi:hypothetical protein
MIAAPVDPAHHDYFFTGIGCTQFAAVMRPFQLPNKIEHKNVLFQCHKTGCLISALRGGSAVSLRPP